MNRDLETRLRLGIRCTDVDEGTYDIAGAIALMTEAADFIKASKGTATAPDPRLDEWEKLANAATEVEREYHNGNIATQYRLDSGHRQSVHEALSDAAFEAIPALIGMVRERDDQVIRSHEAHKAVCCAALNLHDRAIAAEMERDKWKAKCTNMAEESIRADSARAEAEARATAAEARVRELEKIIEKACAAIHEVHSGDMSAYEVMDILTRAET
jgi:hypothetical protein